MAEKLGWSGTRSTCSRKCKGALFPLKKDVTKFRTVQVPGRGQRGVWGHSEMKEKMSVASHVHMPLTLVLIKMLSSAQIFIWLLICQGNNFDDNF